MQSITDIPDEQLQAELERRAKAKRLAEKTAMISDPDLTQLKASCQEYIDKLFDDEGVKDYDCYIYKAVMEALFGKHVFD